MKIMSKSLSQHLVRLQRKSKLKKRNDIFIFFSIPLHHSSVNFSCSFRLKHKSREHASSCLWNLSLFKFHLGGGRGGGCSLGAPHPICLHQWVNVSPVTRLHCSCICYHVVWKTGTNISKKPYKMLVPVSQNACHDIIKDHNHNVCHS